MREIALKRLAAGEWESGFARIAPQQQAQNSSIETQRTKEHEMTGLEYRVEADCDSRHYIHAHNAFRALGEFPDNQPELLLSLSGWSESDVKKLERAALDIMYSNKKRNYHFAPLICKGNIVAVPAEFFEEDADRDTVQVEIVCEATPRDVLILMPGMVERYTEDEIAESGMHAACWVVRKLDNNEAWVVCSDYMTSAA